MKTAEEIREKLQSRKEQYENILSTMYSEYCHNQEGKESYIKNKREYEIKIYILEWAIEQTK